jgi:hypothetical protein
MRGKTLSGLSPVCGCRVGSERLKSEPKESQPRDHVIQLNVSRGVRFLACPCFRCAVNAGVLLIIMDDPGWHARRRAAQLTVSALNPSN